VLSWTYERCADSEFAVPRGTGGDAIMCKPCPSGGGDCLLGVTAVVERQSLLSLPHRGGVCRRRQPA
jgi:hypothetical protein